MVPDSRPGRQLLIKNNLPSDGSVWVLFDWGDTLMRVFPEFSGPMVNWPHLAAMPGAIETLATLSEYYRIALATNAEDSGEEEIRAALRKVGLDPWIEEVFCIGRLGSRKPERDYFLAISKELNAKPDQIIMVGDSFATDVQGALNAGLRGIWLNTISSEDRQGSGYFTVHTLEEIILKLHDW